MVPGKKDSLDIYCIKFSHGKKSFQTASGMDIVTQLSKVANHITFSQNKQPYETIDQRKQRQSLLPSGVVLQDNVKMFTLNGAVFIDGSTGTFSVVIFATGILQFFSSN